MKQKWWLQNNIRMIQNNIRDIDAEMDIDYEVAKLKEFGANVLQIGCGGITAFSNTALATQKKSPYLKDDMFGKMLAKCHENGIRVIARFDISKVHESFLQTHPEWFGRSLTGDVIRYHDTVATCVNGSYQQSEALGIIAEIIEKYPVDGIFFNMFGYQTYDYSANYVGICQCENCKKRFKEMYGLDLPTQEKDGDPVFEKYKEFKTITVKQQLKKISDTVHSLKDDVAVSTYADEYVDIIRSESNSAVDRPLPFWIYQSSENVETVYATFKEKISSNVAINAVDLPYRFMGVSKYLNQIRLFENMANNGALDWCIIGSFKGYPDEENFELTKNIFKFREKYEQYYNWLMPQPKILMVLPKTFYQPPLGYVCKEYRGIFKMLKESHHQFTSVIGSYAGAVADKLDSFDVVIIPEMSDVKDEAFKNALKATKAVVIASGVSVENDADYLKELFGVTLKGDMPVRGSYVLAEPQTVFKDFAKRKWVYMDGRFCETETEQGVEKLLCRITDARFGPPERCFGHSQTNIPAVTVKNGNRIYMPWQPGTLYYSQGYEDFKKLYLDIINAFANVTEKAEITAPPCVEAVLGKNSDGKYLLHLLNLSGFNGTTFTKPLPISGIKVKLNGVTPKRIALLTLDGEKEKSAANEFEIDTLGDYAVYLIEE